MKNQITSRAGALLAVGFMVAANQSLAVNITVADPNQVRYSATNSTILNRETDGTQGPGLNTNWWYKGDDGAGGNAAYSYTSNPSQTGIRSEYEEVEPGMSIGKTWDLVAFTADHTIQSNQKLGLLSSYNLRDGASTFLRGDIFVAIDPTQVTSFKDSPGQIDVFGPKSQNINTTGPLNNTVPGPGVYDFAIRLNLPVSGSAGTYSNATYTVYKLRKAGDLGGPSTFLDTYYAGEDWNAASNPWKLEVNGEQVVGTYALTYYHNNFTNSQASAKADFAVTNVTYFAELQHMEWLSPFQTAANTNESYFHFTMGCGNDNLTGYDSAGYLQEVPDSGMTLIMIGAGLFGMTSARGFRRRRT